ncbi:MAG TPA: L,D-transpeptidase [Pseudolabrys sp.]|nr:L,D-transpeptidase [Pseudolabrys sp.]
MIRRFGALLLTLPALAAVPAATASAQSYPPSQPYYNSAPPHGYQIDPNDPDVAIRRPMPQAQRPARGVPYPEESDVTPPPPPFAPFNSADQDDRDDPQAIRPPGAVGATPVPPAQQQQAAPPENATSVMQLPPEDQPETGQPKELPANLKKQVVDFQTKEPAGTIIIDTPHTYLYLVLGGGRAMRYGIGVGREGFTWSGTERISRMKEWPDWFPPTEMIERQPYLPRMMAGGPGNPLGARALYLGNTLYRIHGTNQPSTIGQTVSSGCIRLLNDDIEDLFSRVQVGTRVVVLPGQMPPQTAAISSSQPPSGPSNISPPTINGLTGQPMKLTR